MNPQETPNSRTQFLSNIGWTHSTLNVDVKEAVDALLVEFHINLARHGFDIGSNTEFKR